MAAGSAEAGDLGWGTAAAERGFRVRIGARLAIGGAMIAGVTMRGGRPPDYLESRSKRFLNKFRQTPGRRLGSRRPRGRLGRRRRRRGSGRRGERGGWAPSRRPVRSRRRRAGRRRRRTAGLAQASRVIFQMQPISVRDHGPQWMNIPKRQSFHSCIRAADP